METRPLKTKVLFVITKSNFGGAQKYVYDLATSLPHETFEVAVALGGHGILKDKLLNAHIRTTSIPFLARDVNPFGDIKTFFELVRLFRTERPHVLHLNSSKVGIMGGLAARLAGIPCIIFTVHGWAFNENRSVASRLIIKTLSWVTVLLTHKTIAVSDALARDMNWIGTASKMQVIKNGIHTQEHHSRDEAREFLSNVSGNAFPKDAFIFGTIAELHPNKGLSYAIHAFARIASQNPNSFYVIVGDGQDEATLRTLIAEKKLTNRVFLLGFLEHAASYLKAFDCFVLPSLTEALGYVLLEAGNAELPVIASNVGGISEIIIDMKTGLLADSKNIDSLENMMQEMLTSATHGSELAQALHAKVRHEYDFSRMLSQTINLYLQK